MTDIECLISNKDLDIVASLLKRENEKAGDAYPTDEEVMTAVKFFYSMINIGNSMKQGMLSAWAVNHFAHYNNVAWARGLNK